MTFGKFELNKCKYAIRQTSIYPRNSTWLRKSISPRVTKVDTLMANNLRVTGLIPPYHFQGIITLSFNRKRLILAQALSKKWVSGWLPITNNKMEGKSVHSQETFPRRHQRDIDSWLIWWEVWGVCLSFLSLVSLHSLFHSFCLTYPVR